MGTPADRAAEMIQKWFGSKVSVRVDMDDGMTNNFEIFATGKGPTYLVHSRMKKNHKLLHEEGPAHLEIVKAAIKAISGGKEPILPESREKKNSENGIKTKKQIEEEKNIAAEKKAQEQREQEERRKAEEAEKQAKEKEAQEKTDREEAERLEKKKKEEQALRLKKKKAAAEAAKKKKQKEEAAAIAAAAKAEMLRQQESEVAKAEAETEAAIEEPAAPEKAQTEAEAEVGAEASEIVAETAAAQMEADKESKPEAMSEVAEGAVLRNSSEAGRVSRLARSFTAQVFTNTSSPDIAGGGDAQSGEVLHSHFDDLNRQVLDQIPARKASPEQAPPALLFGFFGLNCCRNQIRSNREESDLESRSLLIFDDSKLVGA